MENNIEQKIGDWKASIRVESASWNDIIDAYTEDYMEANDALWEIVVEGRDIINQLTDYIQSLQGSIRGLTGTNDFLGETIERYKKEFQEKIDEIETEKYGWRFDELKSDYNSILEQLEEANEELAIYKMQEINLLTEIQKIENGN